MKPLFCSWCALTLVCLNLSGDVISLVSVADTTISEGNAAHTNPSADTMIVGRLGPNGGGSKSRGLIRFDLSAIPAGAVITSATFTVSVTISHIPNATDTLSIHRLNVNWEEAEATWDAGEVPWVGGEFAQPADSTLAMQGTNTFIFPSTPQMIATAQLWLTNASSNYGFVLLNQNEETLANARRIRTRESVTGQPALTIGYTTAPPLPPVFRIISLGLSNNRVVLTSTGTNGWQVVPEYSSNLVSSNWAIVPSYTNSFFDGTNVTIFDRLDPICGPNVFLRVRNTRN